MSISIISKYRNYFMGLAVIFILIFHLSISFEGIFDIFKNYFDFGVNIFFIISGFSIYYAWEKNPHTLIFLKKRISRIMVSFLPIVLVWCIPQFLIGRISLTELFLKVSTIKFWIDGNLLYWYISGILLCYLVTPIWIKLFKKNTRLVLFITTLICISLILLARIGILSYIRCFTDRVPVYFMGIIMGYASKKELKISKVFVFVNVALLVVGLAVMSHANWNIFDYNNKYVVYMLWTLPFVIFIGVAFEKTHQYLSLRWLLFLGSISLEIYLLHERILFASTLILSKLGIHFDKYQIVINIVVIVMTIISAYLYQIIINGINAKVNLFVLRR